MEVTHSDFGAYLDGRLKLVSLASNRPVTRRIRSYNKGDRAFLKWLGKSEEFDRSILSNRSIDLITKELQNVVQQVKGDRPIDFIWVIFQNVCKKYYIGDRPIDRKSKQHQSPTRAACQAGSSKIHQGTTKTQTKGFEPATCSIKLQTN